MSKLNRVRCPTCGKTGFRAVTRAVTARVGNRTITVRGIPVEECLHCGERLYDPAALRRIREAREAARRTRAA